ncbi:MAG: hypothetical protein NVS3B26_14420 [Mycobacteriales bacterium]
MERAARQSVRTRRSRLADAACATGLLVGWFEPVVLTSATPFLLSHHDLLLEALSSSAVSIVTGGALARVGRSPLLLVLLAPLSGVALADVFLWWAGRRWGDRIVSSYRTRSPRSGRWIDTADRWVGRRGILALAAAYFLPVPNALLYLSCGTAGMPLLTFLVGDAIGTMIWTGLLVEIGWSIGRRGVHIVDAVQHYELLLVVGAVLCAVLLHVLRRRGRLRVATTPAGRPSRRVLTGQPTGAASSCADTGCPQSGESVNVEQPSA